MAKIVEPSTTIDDDEATIDYSGLENQEGNLYVISSILDLCTFDGALSGYELPTSATLTNRLAILAYTLYDGKGTPENKADDVNITESVTKMTFSDGTNNYTVNGRDADGHIYVAIRPTDNANITITAGLYEKSLTGKTYAAGQFYNITNRMEKVKYFTINDSGTTGNTVNGTSDARYTQAVIGNFACTFICIGKWTLFRKVECTS